MLYEGTIRKIIVCPTCKGQKTVPEYFIHENCELQVPCTDCDQNGMVKRVVNIKYEKL
jgi:DnaJ-class molecular chaperone